MARVPDSLRPVERGTVVHMVSQASRQCDVLPWELLDYSVKPDCVVIILPAGQKVSFPLVTTGQPGAAAPVTTLPESAPEHEIPLSEAAPQEVAVEIMHKIAGRRQGTGGNGRRRKVSDV